jgi:hypothetical protein
MRTLLVETFQSTLNDCFIRTVQDMLGSRVTEELCELLKENGVPPRDIALRFDEVIGILTRVFGNSARVLVYKTVASLYEEYSQRPGFSFYDSLRDQVDLLKVKVVADLLKPRHFRGIDDSFYITTR